MSYAVYKAGQLFLAHLLAGQGGKIDGMYVEYGTVGMPAAPTRTQEYFDALETSEVSGYARVPVMSIALKDNGTVVFTAMMQEQDLLGAGIQQGSMSRCATLAILGPTRAEDQLLFTVDCTPSPLVHAAATSVHVNMHIG